MQLTDLPTPVLILDRTRLTANLRRMADHMRELGVALRPHLKTAKSAEVARLVQDYGAIGLTVSTVAEAEYFVKHGFKSITYAVGFSSEKLSRLVPLMEAGADISVIVDSQAAAYALIGAAAPYDVTPKALVEIDTGGHRGGLAPNDPTIVAVARLLHEAPDVDLAGVLTHAGHSYGCRSEAAVKAVAEAERDGVVQAAELLRQAGLPCPVVSVGSTPTAVFADDLTGVTEARPGVYMFGDLYQSMLGCCTIDDIAVSVMATVIGHRPEHDRVLIDAGALALSQDRGPDAFGPPLGLGQVCTLDGPAPIDGVRVLDAHQEHGFVGRPDGTAGPSVCDLLPIGTRVRILPNHACMTAAQYTEYTVVDGDQDVVTTWGRCSGW
jgi:D-serine deaminase-like pyridoxal phosphate-dependent protein